MIKLANILTILIIVISVCSSGKTKVQAEDMVIYIVANSGPFGSIEQAAVSENKVNFWDDNFEDDDACTECFSAVELRHFLMACAGIPAANIQLSRTKELPRSGYVFVIGNRRSNPLVGSLPAIVDGSLALTTPESFRIRVVPRESGSVCIIEGNGRVGTLYGVYAYLERLGMRFFGLGEQGTVYPAGKVAISDEALDLIENPAFLTRGFYAWEDRGNEELFLWMARNRMNFWTSAQKEIPLLKKLGMRLAIGAHDVLSNFLNPSAEYPYESGLVSSGKDRPMDPYRPSRESKIDVNESDGKLTYFEAHPEWYGLQNGKRSDKADISPGDNYCTSNMDANKELAKNLVHSLSDGEWKNVDIVDFWMLDNGRWCECENCKNQGNLSDRLMDVAYVVQKEIQKAQQEKRLNREVLLATLAYHETLPPPERSLPKDFDYDHFMVTFFVIERCYAHTISDPACTEINKFLLENYQGWTMGSGRNYKGSIQIGEYFNVSSIKSLPIVFPTIMSTDIPWYYRTGTRHMHYMHTPTHIWGTWTLNQYLYARLLWNVETETDALLNEFFNQYYPTTSETTRKFYKHLEIAFSNLKPFKHYAGPPNKYGSGIYSMRRRLMVDTLEIFPMDHLHYESHHPLLNDAPDIVDMINELRLARKEIDRAMLQCTDKTEKVRLIDDDRRFAYGEAMVYFYYHLVRTALFHRSSNVIMAKHEFLNVEKYAEILRNITDLVAPIPSFSSGDANAKDGMEASQAENVYNYFKQKYGN